MANATSQYNTPVGLQQLDSLNPRNYGAKGDGSTDDTAAIVACIAAAVFLGKNVRFDSGVYLVSDRISIASDNLEVIGQPGAIIRWSSNPTGGIGIWMTANSCRISTLELDGNSKAGSGIFLDSTSSKGAHNIIENIISHNWVAGHGIALDGQTNATTAFNEVKSCYCYTNAFIGISQNKATDSWIHDCLSYNNGDEGITIDNGSNRCRVVNNRVTGNSTAGGVGNIGIDGSSFCVISNNIIDAAGSSQAGIKSQNSVAASSYNTVTGNVFTGNALYQVWLSTGVGGSSTYWTVVGNVMQGGNSIAVNIEAGCNNNVVYPNSLNAQTISNSGTGNSVGTTELISTSSPSGTGTVTFSSIPAIYRDLIVTVRGEGTQSATFTEYDIIVNNDSGNNYDQNNVIFQNGTQSGNSGVAAAHIFAGWVPAATGVTNASSGGRVIFYNYRDTTFQKSFGIEAMVKTANTTAGLFTLRGDAWWRSTSAINRIDVILASGNFVAGTVISLYGVS